MSSIVNILSGPVHSGKTTFLMNWIKDRSEVAGITSPIVNGSRTFCDIAKREFFPMEAAPHEDAFLIGKYQFSKESFIKAENILMNSCSQPLSFLIIDEIGPLELNDQGLHKALVHVLERSPSPLLLVVRDSILKEVITKYRIPQAKVYSIDTFDL